MPQVHALYGVSLGAVGCGLRQFSQRLLGTEIDLDPQRKALAVVYLLERF